MLPAEWYFRSSLDRYVWIHGMICAYMHAWAEANVKSLDSLSRAQRLLTRIFIAGGAPRCLCPLV